MKKLYLAGIAILFCLQASAQCADTTRIFTFKYLGKKYEIVKQFKTWDSAADCAKARGGYLLHLNNATEQDTVFDAIINRAMISSSYTSVMDGGGIAYLWIGATDKASEGRWLWDGDNDSVGFNFWNGQGAAGAGGGTAVSGAYNNWGRSTSGSIQEPDDYVSAQDGGAMALTSWPYGTAGQWNDINITNGLYYVIEYDTVTTTQVINTNLKTADFTIYPNPASDKMYLTGSISVIYNVTIMNTLGQVMFKNSITNGAINVSQLLAGTYIIKIESEDGITKYKSIVILR